MGIGWDGCWGAGLLVLRGLPFLLLGILTLSNCSLRHNEIGFAKTLKIQQHSWVMNKWSIFLQLFLDSLGFAYDFALCSNDGSSNLFQHVFWRSPLKRSEANSFLGDPRNKKRTTIQKNWPQVLFENVEILKFQKVEI